MSTGNWQSAGTPWKAPGPSGRWTISEADGQLLFIVIGGYEPSISTQNGLSPAVRANIVILTGPEAGTEVMDSLIFNTRIVQRLRTSAPGDVILAGVTVEERGNRAVDIYDPGPAGAPIAEAWHNTHPGRLSELGQLAIRAFQQAKSPGPINIVSTQGNQAAGRTQWTPQVPVPAAPAPAWNGNQQGPAPQWGPNPPAQPAQAWTQSVLPGIPPATPQQAGF